MALLRASNDHLTPFYLCLFIRNQPEQFRKKLHEGPSNTNHLTKMDAPLILTLRPTFLLNTCTIILDSSPKVEITPHKLETQYLGLLGPNSTPLYHILITESSSTNLFPKGSSHFTY